MQIQPPPGTRVLVDSLVDPLTHTPSPSPVPRTHVYVDLGNVHRVSLTCPSLDQWPFGKESWTPVVTIGSHTETEGAALAAMTQNLHSRPLLGDGEKLRSESEERLAPGGACRVRRPIQGSSQLSPPFPACGPADAGHGPATRWLLQKRHRLKRGPRNRSCSAWPSPRPEEGRPEREWTRKSFLINRSYAHYCKDPCHVSHRQRGTGAEDGGTKGNNQEGEGLACWAAREAEEGGVLTS